MAYKIRNNRKPNRTLHPAAAHVQTTFQHGLALHQSGQIAQAQMLYEEILKIQPEHYDALHLSGVIAFETKNYQTALDLIDRAIKIHPDATFYYNHGNVLHALTRLDAAVASYDKAIALQSDYTKAYLNRGNVLRELKQPDAAVASYDKAIALKPDYAEAYSNRGNVLHDLKRFDAAVASCDRAIALKPDYAEAYANRGSVLHELTQPDAAVASYDRAIALKPDYAEAYANRGSALHALTQLDAAVVNYDRAIALKPDYAEAYLCKSFALLLGGNFVDGWKSHEWRWATKQMELVRRNFTQQLWLGSESI